jgi:hypothetical protein
VEISSSEEANTFFEEVLVNGSESEIFGGNRNGMFGDEENVNVSERGSGSGRGRGSRIGNVKENEKWSEKKNEKRSGSEISADTWILKLIVVSVDLSCEEKVRVVS